MISSIARYVVGAIIGAVAFFIIRPSPPPEKYTDVIVKEIKGEPDTVRTFVDRIVYRDRAPEQIVTQPGGGEDVIADFCYPDTVWQTLPGDTVQVPIPADTVYLLRSVDEDAGWFFQKLQVSIYGPTSAGELREMRYRSWPGWSVRVGDDVLFREPRFGLFHKAIEAFVYLSVGYAVGKVF